MHPLAPADRGEGVQDFAISPWLALMGHGLQGV
jgi:hypothetical protein